MPDGGRQTQVTEAQFDLFLSVCACICAAGAVLNLAFIGRRGVSAMLLAAAFLVLAGLIWIVKIHASQVLIVVCAILLIALLASDFALRARNRESSR